MRPYSGRLRPRDVRAGSGAPSSAVPLLIPPAASHSAANRPSRNPGTSSAAAPGRTAHPRPPPPPPGEATLGQRLCERGLFPAQVLVLVHQLNQLLTRAPSLEKCAAQVGELPVAALGVVLDLITSGEPCVYPALNLLHFASFHPRLLAALLQLDVVQVLLAVVKANAEYELSRAAMSLLVTLGQHPEGLKSVGASRGLSTLLARFVMHDAAEMRQVCARLLQIALGSPAGRAQAVASIRLQAALGTALQEDRRDKAELKLLSSLQREIALYTQRTRV